MSDDIDTQQNIPNIPDEVLELITMIEKLKADVTMYAQDDPIQRERLNRIQMYYDRIRDY